MEVLRLPLWLGGTAAVVLNALPLAGAAGAAEHVGVVATLKKEVVGTLDNNSRKLSVSSDVFHDELIETKAGASSQILFLDQTALTLGPNSRVVLDEMVFDPATGTGSVVLNLVSGVFRFASGTLDSRSYTIRTPVSNIGVRGTGLLILVSPSGGTMVLLIEGGVEITDINGVRELLTRPGSYSIVGADGAPPTLPDDAPQEFLDLIERSDDIQIIVETLPNLPGSNVPVELQDFVSSVVDNVTGRAGTGAGPGPVAS